MLVLVYTSTHGRIGIDRRKEGKSTEQIKIMDGLIDGGGQQKAEKNGIKESEKDRENYVWIAQHSYQVKRQF